MKAKTNEDLRFPLRASEFAGYVGDTKVWYWPNYKDTARPLVSVDGRRFTIEELEPHRWSPKGKYKD